MSNNTVVLIAGDVLGRGGVDWRLAGSGGLGHTVIELRHMSGLVRTERRSRGGCREQYGGDFVVDERGGESRQIVMVDASD